MNKHLLATLLLASCSASACVQGPWKASLGQKKVAQGAVLSLRYKEPGDSGKVHIAFVALDSTLCPGGWNLMDRYPPLADFDVLMKWGRCGDTSANSDSASVVFRGAERVVMHRDVEERAGFGDVFLVTYSGPSESSLRRVKADADLVGLPPATQADLRAFLRDSLGWAAPPRQ